MSEPPSPAQPPAFDDKSNRVAGALCHVPVQGVFLVVSLYYLFAAKKQNRPYVRFCAIQSLSHFACALTVLGVILLTTGLPTALVHDPTLRLLLGGLLSFALVVYFLWNVGAQAFACYRAYVGRPWVMPWVGFWVRRFLPAPPPSRPG